MKLEINKLEDLKYFSKAYKEGKIKLNISRIAIELKCDRKTVRKALKNEVNKKRKKRKSYLDDYYEIIKNLLNDKNKEFEYINHLYKYLKREYELSCSYSAFRRYIKDNEKLNKKYKTKK